ncbi:hypothetical protein KF728_28290 [Candidatus Obscuribacterales bacterium]|nr:hypothetical protein [Candidatus Obscuribacterales bacterium]
MLKKFDRVIPLCCALLVLSGSALAAENWADKSTSVSIKEYFELVLASKFRNLNPTEPAEVHFVADSSPDKALLIIVRSVVTPDLDLTDDSSEKKEIVSEFRNNVSKQSDSFIASCKKLFGDQSVATRWPKASVEKNVAIRFVRSDNAKQTVALMINGKTIFEPSQIAAESKDLMNRAGEYWSQ